MALSMNVKSLGVQNQSNTKGNNQKLRRSPTSSKTFSEAQAIKVIGTESANRPNTNVIYQL